MSSTWRAQPALFHGPGSSGAIVVWRARGDMPASFFRVRISELLREHAEGAARTLVAVAPALLDDDQRRALSPLSVLPRRHGGVTMPSTRGSLLVQVAADRREDVIAVLRRSDELFAAIADRDEETLGGWAAVPREPFGFRESAGPTPEQVRAMIIEKGALAGATYLLYQRYVQDRARFARRREVDRERIVGRTPDGALVTAPPSAHVRRMWGSALVRRGLAYREDGVEGLAYVAIARDPQVFADVLDGMLGARDGITDAMLPYIEAVSGGLYVVPPI